MGRPDFETIIHMNFVGLMFELTRYIFSTGKEVIINRGLCVLRGILRMSKRGVYESIFMK